MRKVFVALLLAGSWLLLTAILSGCGSSSIRTTRFLFVADWQNNRVLEYETPFNNGESASVVLGQAAFNTRTSGTTGTTMLGPSAVAVDATGNLYVSDTFNCRVLQFKSPFTTGMSASLAVGQAGGAANLTTSVCAATATGLGEATHVAIDSSGNLWVSDSTNHRVLKYPAPIIAGETATVVLGQTIFTASTCNQGLAAPTAATLCNPGGLGFDSGGDLWVMDTSNNRVLMYTAANLATGGSATVVLGQPGFVTNTSNNGGISANSLSLGFGANAIAFDSTGNLWVTDTANNRALMYPKASLATNGAAATVVLGQTSFTASGCGTSAATLCAPVGLAFDNKGDLAVADGENSRILGFTPPFSSGMSATLVLGQANFTTGTANTGGEGAATLDLPAGLAASF